MVEQYRTADKIEPVEREYTVAVRMTAGLDTVAAYILDAVEEDTVAVHRAVEPEHMIEEHTAVVVHTVAAHMIGEHTVAVAHKIGGRMAVAFPVRTAWVLVAEWLNADMSEEPVENTKVAEKQERFAFPSNPEKPKPVRSEEAFCTNGHHYKRERV